MKIFCTLAVLLVSTSLIAQESYRGPYTGNEVFKIGDEVEAVYAGSWYKATIVGVAEAPAKYKVHFEDEKYCRNHELDESRSREYVRPRKRADAVNTGNSAASQNAAASTTKNTSGAPKVANGGNNKSAGWARFKVGDRVLYRSAGKLWQEAIVKEIGTQGLEDKKYKLAAISRYTGRELDGLTWEWHERVASLERQPEWTSFFVGNWDIYVPGATNLMTDGRNVYRTFSGGMKLPPLQVRADRTYSWRLSNGKTITGRWEPCEKNPGIILKKADQGADWTLYNANDRSSLETFKTDVIYLSAEEHTYQVGHRKK